MNFKRICVAAAMVSAFATSGALANEWVVGDAAEGKGGATQFNVGFAGDGHVLDAMLDLNYDAREFSAKVQELNGASCTIHPKGGIVRVITPVSDQPLGKGVMALCNVTLMSNGSMAKGKPALTIAGSECSRGLGKDAGCDLSSAGEVAK
jgi:hypothetical protein